jgi:hypothetical protein
MAATLKRLRKDPDAKRDITLNWGSHVDANGATVSYLPSGVTIVAAASSVSPAGGVTVTSTTVTGAGTKTTTRIAGGLPGLLYDVAVHITMSNGEEDDRSVTIDVRQR